MRVHARVQVCVCVALHCPDTSALLQLVLPGTGTHRSLWCLITAETVGIYQGLNTAEVLYVNLAKITLTQIYFLRLVAAKLLLSLYTEAR